MYKTNTQCFIKKKRRPLPGKGKEYIEKDIGQLVFPSLSKEEKQVALIKEKSKSNKH